MSREGKNQVLFQILILRLLQDICTCGAGRNGVGAGRNPCENVDKKRCMQSWKTCWKETGYVLTPPYAFATKITSDTVICIDMGMGEATISFLSLIDQPKRVLSCVFAKNDWIFLIFCFCIFGVQMHKTALQSFEKNSFH